MARKNNCVSAIKSYIVQSLLVQAKGRTADGRGRSRAAPATMGCAPPAMAPRQRLVKHLQPYTLHYIETVYELMSVIHGLSAEGRTSVNSEGMIDYNRVN